MLEGFYSCTGVSAPFTVAEIWGAVQQVADGRLKFPCNLPERQGSHLPVSYQCLGYPKAFQMAWDAWYRQPILISRAVERKAWFRLPLVCSWGSVKLAKRRHRWYVGLGTMGYPTWPRTSHVRSASPVQLLGVCGAPGVSNYIGIWIHPPWLVSFRLRWLHWPAFSVTLGA